MKNSSSPALILFATFLLLLSNQSRAAFFHMDSVSCATLYVSISSTPADSGCNGWAVTNVNGGTQPYVYNWSNAAVTSGLNNLCPGTYSLTVTDANACLRTASVYIDSAAVNRCTSFSLIITHTNAVSGCSGTISALATGGTAPYL